MPLTVCVCVCVCVRVCVSLLGPSSLSVPVVAVFFSLVSPAVSPPPSHSWISAVLEGTCNSDRSHSVLYKVAVVVGTVLIHKEKSQKDLINYITIH